MKNKTIKLYHYSDKKIDGVISPRHFGENYYTANDCTTSSVKRSFFYLIDKPAENLLTTCKYLYIANIDACRLYDLRTDKNGYIKRYNNITILLNAIISAGFIGTIYTLGGYDVAILFKDIKISETITRRR